jgi:vancomycin resistance protein YoaR
MDAARPARVGRRCRVEGAPTMTTASDLLPPPADTSVARRRGDLRGFIAAFVLSAFVTLGLAGAAVLAYDSSYDGRILPGVRVGSVDLSGLDRTGATTALAAGYSAYGEGRVVVRTVAGDVSIAYREFSRRPDVEALIDAAMSAGRTGNPLERALAEPRLALRGLDLGPRVAFDEGALDSGIAAALVRLEREPVDATIAIEAGGIVTTPARPGRRFDPAAVQVAARDAVRRPDASSEVVVDAVATAVPPRRDDVVVLAARAAAERIIADIVVTHASKTWTIPAATVRGWVRFESSSDGTVGTMVDETAIPAALDAIAKAVLVKPVSASFLVGKNGATVGATASKDGRQLDAAATAAAIAKALGGRAKGAAPAPVPATVVAVAPKLTTEEARKVAPLMVRLSSWKTKFPIGERNHWGANIWLPAKFINGTVLKPGQSFEWFSAVGPITTARGFGPGGVIDGDHTDPTGAMGGGMCSSSTTLFNAALRAGLEMGVRANHAYYIDRYPLGLDATITIKGGSTTTMTFTNDMVHPILIRGYKVVGSGGIGWVRYEIWGVPDGRTVSIGQPIVTNLQKAVTKTFDVTTLPKGVRKQTEYPSNGMDVSVTRVVRDSDGHVLHHDTYRSHYKLWNGRIEVGV